MRSKIVNSALVFVLASGIYLGIILHPVVKQNVEEGYFDFVSFYTAGLVVRNGLASRLYEYQTQSDFEQRLTRRRGLLPFNHPPFEALLYAPLAFFPYLWAYRIWVLINFVLTGISAFLLRGPLEKIQGLFPRLVVVLCAFIPLFVTIVQGQDSILMLFLYALVFVSLKGQRELRAGCFLGLALLKFQLVIPFLMVFFVKRRWKVVWGCAATAALLIIASLGLFGFAGVVDWVQLVRRQNANLPNAGIPDETIFPVAMPNLRGVLYAVLEGKLPVALLGLLVGVASAILILWGLSMWGSAGNGEDRAFELSFALMLLIGLLVSYHLYIHDLVLIGLPILLVLSYFETSPLPRSPRRLIFTGSALLLFVIAVVLFNTGSRQFHLLFWPELALAFALSSEITALRKLGAET